MRVIFVIFIIVLVFLAVLVQILIISLFTLLIFVHRLVALITRALFDFVSIQILLVLALDSFVIIQLAALVQIVCLTSKLVHATQQFFIPIIRSKLILVVEIILFSRVKPRVEAFKHFAHHCLIIITTRLLFYFVVIIVLIVVFILIIIIPISRHAISQILLLRSSLSSSIIPILEHLLAFRIQRPIVAFARLSFLSRHFNKAIVQAQVVSDRVLPALAILVIVRKSLHDELINSVQSNSVIGRVFNSHGNQSYVGVGRFLGLAQMMSVEMRVLLKWRGAAR